MRRDSPRYGNFPKRRKSRERPWNRASPAFGKLWEHVGKYRVDLYNSSEKNGFEILADILSINPDSKVVILSSYDMPIYKKMAFDKGAADFINKSVSMEELVERLKRVLCNKTYYNKIPDIEVLTEREIEILRAICKGDIKKKIAKNLFISERTLYNHIQNIYDKLEVSNTVEAYNKAIKLGYIEPLM